MISADVVVRRALEHGFSLFTGVPCSYLTPLINCLAAHPDVRYVPASNEGDGIAVAAGAELGGLRGVAMFQNSGLGNAINPLTSLTHTFQIPVLLLITLRGQPGGPADEPQHELMGGITGRLLDLIGVPWLLFPSDEHSLRDLFKRALQHFEQSGRPFASVLPRDIIAPWPGPPAARNPTTISAAAARPATTWAPVSELCQRAEMVDAVRASTRDQDVIVATTGYTGRELFAAGDQANQFYMVGSMGCAVSIGLGIALAKPDRRVVVLDGDGAALMRMGALAAVGHLKPANLFHVVFDNGCHESTGGQHTVTTSTDLGGVARACGYPHVVRSATPSLLSNELREWRGGLTFAHVPIRTGTRPRIPRPDISPPDVAQRLRHFLAGDHAKP